MKQLDLFGPRVTGRDVYDAPAKLNPTVAPEDAPRLTAALQRLYDLMRDGEWHMATELSEVAGRRYGGRLHDLSLSGIPHESERFWGGEWRYRLIASPTNGVKA
jgi:hypothetical protein